MKFTYKSIVPMLGLLFLTGCTDQPKAQETKQAVKVDAVELEPSYVSEKEDYTMPFKIREIKSFFVELNDDAFEKPLKGVRYEVLLVGDKELTFEEKMADNFEVVTDASLLEAANGPIQHLSLTDTRDGFLYTLVFETIYQDYTEEELETLYNERNFHIFFTYDGVRKVVDFDVE